jgi:hypothetical protein
VRLAPALLLALAACTAAPELLPHERAAGAAAFTAWAQAGLPEPDKGRCDVRTFRVRMASAERFVQDCRTAPEAAYACTAWETTDELFRWRDVPVVVIAPWWHSEPGIVVHEICHALIRCSGIGPSARDAGDSKHTDPRVWKAEGGETSVQARAMKLLE